MSKLESCDLCGTHTSGVKNERLKEYQDLLIKSSVVARDEKALVFVAKDMLDNLISGVGSSVRTLPHEDEDKVMFSRYTYAEDSVNKINIAIRCLQEAERSLQEHLNGLYND